MAANALSLLLHEFRLESNEAAILKALIGSSPGVLQSQQATAKGSDLVAALQDGPRTNEAARAIVDGLVATKAIRVDNDELRLCLVVLAQWDEDFSVVRVRLNPDFCRMVEQLAKHRDIASI